MKKLMVISALLSAALLAGGCDFFRSLAGRPTSEDIARKKALLDAREAESALAAQKAREEKELALKDSLEVVEALSANPKLLVSSVKISSSVLSSLPDYCIVIGSFGNLNNASKLAASLEAEGYRSVLLPYNSGMTGVGVNPTGSIVDAYRNLQKLIEAGLCPKDSWILDNRNAK